jgi:hypothetical protein
MSVPFLDPVEFREWLKYHKDDKIGVPVSSYHCPIARWVKSQGVPMVHVGANSFAIRFEDSENDIVYPLPEWAKMFVEIVDSDYGYGGKPITGSQALEILDYCLSKTFNWVELDNSETQRVEKQEECHAVL